LGLSNDSQAEVVIMGFFISQSGVYHEGDALPGDTAVAQRPSYFHKWVGGDWQLDLVEMRATYSNRVDIAAGNTRLKYITDIAGQQMTYQEKVRQAEMLQANPALTATDCPLIFGEVGITAADAPGVAAVILARYASWQQIGAAIEKARLTAKNAIKTTANDEDDANLILSQISWP
jgi:hypothetical protein